jgi:PIN domain nuclease of toxin-antitoxin system
MSTVTLDIAQANLSDLIEDDSNQKIVSMASMWEMAIKISIGRLKVSEPFELLIPRQIQINGFELLPIQYEHALLHYIPHLPQTGCRQAAKRTMRLPNWP